MYAQDSIDMLTGAGIQFKRHEDEGIDIDHFAELVYSSGLVLSEDITWITFARLTPPPPPPPLIVDVCSQHLPRAVAMILATSCAC